MKQGRVARRTPRVVLVVNATAVGGMEALCVDLAREYTRRGLRVAVAVPAAPNLDILAERFEATGARVRRIETGPRGSWPGQLRGALNAWRLIRRFRADVVHLHTGGANGATPPALALAIACRLLRRPLVLTEHANPVRRGRRRVRMRRWLLDRLASATVQVSRRNAELRRANLGGRVAAAAVVRNGIVTTATQEVADLRSRGREALRLDGKQLVVGVAARFVEDKHVDDLLRAFALLPARDSLRLLLVGDGPERAELERLACELGIQRQTSFAGFQREAKRYMAAMDLFVLPVATGSMSIALLEAMELGVAPIITFCGPDEAVLDGVTGLCAPARNPVALSAAIGRLVGDAELRGRLGRAARAYVHREFSIERVADEYLAIYRR